MFTVKFGTHQDVKAFHYKVPLKTASRVFCPQVTTQLMLFLYQTLSLNSLHSWFRREYIKIEYTRSTEFCSRLLRSIVCKINEVSWVGSTSRRYAVAPWRRLNARRRRAGGHCACAGNRDAKENWYYAFSSRWIHAKINSVIMFCLRNIYLYISYNI